MTRAFYLITIFLLAGCYGFAQQAVVDISLFDSETNDPLQGATVQLGSIGKTSDFSGNAIFHISPGYYILQCRYIGYENYRDSIAIEGNDSLFIKIELNPTSLLLETATVTTSRNKLSVAEATVSIDVLKPGFLKRNNAVSLDEALDRIPGVQILDGQPNIRGGSGYSYGAGSRVLLLLNDIPVLQADAGFPNWRDLPIENAGQIEVLKGAGSALYGSAAMNGIINMKTDYARSEPETEVMTFAKSIDRPAESEKAWWSKGASPKTYGGHLIHRRKWNKTDLSAGMYHLNSDNYYRDARNLQTRIYANGKHRISDRLTASLGAMYNTGENRSFFYWNEAGSMIGDSSALSSGQFNRFYLDPSLTYFDHAGNRHKFLGRYMYIENNNINDQSNSSHWFYGEYQFQRSWMDNKWTLNSGLVGVRSWTDSPLFLNSRIYGNNLAAYGQLEHRPSERLTLSAGVRYEFNQFETSDVVLGDTIDRNALMEGSPVFRFGANYKLGTATYLRGSWGQGYRFPTIAEKFISTNAGVLPISPNPELESETGWSSELGVKQGFQFGRFQGFFDLSFFWSQYRNMMEFTLFFDDNNFSFQSQNIGETRIRGVELSVQGRGDLGDVGIEFLAGYTFLDPRFLDFDLSGNDIPINERENASDGQLNAANSSVDYNILKYRSQHQIKADMQLTWRSVSLGWALRYASHVEAVDRIFEEALPGVKDYRDANDTGYKVLDLRFGYSLMEHHKMTFLVQNVLNEDYTVRPGLLEEPRSFTLQYILTL